MHSVFLFNDGDDWLSGWLRGSEFISRQWPTLYHWRWSPTTHEGQRESPNCDWYYVQHEGAGTTFTFNDPAYAMVFKLALAGMQE